MQGVQRMARDWSDFEVEAVVGDYFAMLLKELRGEGYSKAGHRHSLNRPGFLGGSNP
jgi:hypothetical protein